MLQACAMTSYTYFHFAYEFTTRKLAYMLYSLVRVSRRVIWSHFYKFAKKPLSLGTSLRLGHQTPAWLLERETELAYWWQYQKVISIVLSTAARMWPLLNPYTESRPTSPSINTLHTLPSQRFQVCLTLFSKFFSSFLHSTCMLSVSH